MVGRLHIVTGVAGFIGSHVAEALLARGDRVRGIDCFTDFYARERKERNLEALRSHPRFELAEADLAAARDDSAPNRRVPLDDRPLEGLLEGADSILHLAGAPGVTTSWADFGAHDRGNVVATQRLLAAAAAAGTRRIVLASSSSVYGDAARVPTPEDEPLRPRNPYGISKVTAELLGTAYAAAHGLEVVPLRLFTVYGPRQRPDMAVHRLLRAVRTGQPFPLRGDGSLVRDLTYVGDAAEAFVAAVDAPVEGEPRPLNIGGGSPVSVRELVDAVTSLTGRPVPVVAFPIGAGEATRTGADTAAARRFLGWRPRVDLAEGIARQLESLDAETGAPVRRAG